MTSVFCTNCGSRIPDISRFCTSCGTPIKVQENIPHATTSAPSVVFEEIKQKKSPVKLVIIALAILVVGIVSALFWNSGNKISDASQKAKEQYKLDSIAAVEKKKLDSLAFIANTAAQKAVEAAAQKAINERTQSQVSSTNQNNLPETLTILGQNDVNLRQSPGVFAAKLGKLNRGQVCRIIKKGQRETIEGISDYWYNINAEGTVGWVFGEFTSLKD